MLNRWFVILVIAFSFLNLIGCSYNSKLAVKNGDIVDLHGEIINMERLSQFIENADSKKNDNIRVTRYTVEGDPIFYDLKYDGKKINLKYDNSKDKFGKNNIFRVVCDNINHVEMEYGIQYSVIGCAGERSEVPFLLIPNNR